MNYLKNILINKKYMPKKYQQTYKQIKQREQRREQYLKILYYSIAITAILILSLIV